MHSSPVLLVLGAHGPPGRRLPGIDADVDRWVAHAPLLAGPDAHIFTCGDGEATAARLRATARRAIDRLNPQTSLIVVILGHGGTTSHGPGVWSDDGEVVPLAALLDGIPTGCRTTWYLELCGTSGPEESIRTIRPHDVVHRSSHADQPSEQRRIHGTWTGAWSYAVTTVLEQASGTCRHGRPTTALDHATLSHRAGLILAGLGLPQRPTLAGPVHRLRSGILPGAHPVALPVPRRAMQVSAGTESLWSHNGDAWVGMVWKGDKVQFQLRTGKSVSDLPSTLTLHWRAPTPSELNELGGPSFKCASDTFTNVGAVTAGGGRLYESAGRTFVLAFAPSFDKIVWWTEASELDSNDHIQPTTGAESMNHVGSPPSAPAGGWEKAVDQA